MRQHLLTSSPFLPFTLATLLLGCGPDTAPERTAVATTTTSQGPAASTSAPVSTSPAGTPSTTAKRATTASTAARGAMVPPTGGAGAGDGTWGSFTYGPASYGAIERGCKRGTAEAGGATDELRFLLVDGQTKNQVLLRLLTQNGAEYGLELEHADGQRIDSASIEARDVDGERTVAEGRLASGATFSFELLIVGACN